MTQSMPTEAIRPALGATVMWIEAERFTDPGGWCKDDQFVDLIGSPYLMAHGLGRPVKDAVTALTVPRTGSYRLWVRSKDWFPSHHPGRFQVAVGGRTLESVFGASGKAGWHWEDGDVLQLSAGHTEVSLVDLTGYNARCDALFFTDDLNAVPPDDSDGVECLRNRWDPARKTMVVIPDHDVLVIGGGLAGCTAAVAAARNGARVALIQNRPVLGGNASSEILVPPVGLWPHGDADPLNPRETGLVEEYRTIGNQRVAEGKLYEKRLHRIVAAEANIDLFLGTHALTAERDGNEAGHIGSVLALDTRTGQRLRFAGKLVVDCSGDSVVAVSAGADVRTGKESREMHQELWAPDQPSPNTMGNGLKYTTYDTGEPASFEAPAWAFLFHSCSDFGPRRHPRFNQGEAIGYQWQIELGGRRDTFADAEEIRDDLLRLIFGIWDHVKNRCQDFSPDARNHALDWVGFVAGKRENRRLLGDTILTQNDIARQTLFPDRVAYGAWVVDDHHSGGFFHDGSFGKHEDDRDHAYQGVEFSIPFAALYSRNIDNLLMAGRNISATHLAMSDTRVMLTCAIMGHAVGTAAALCVRYDMTPRALRNARMQELQQHLLKEGATIPKLKANDPQDLARDATLAASSEGVDHNGEPMPVIEVFNGIARAENGSPNAWRPAIDAEPPHWLVLCWDRPVTFNSVHVVFQTAWCAPTNVELKVAWGRAWTTIATIAENRHRRLVLGLDTITTSALRIEMPQAVGICEVRVYHEPQDVVETQKRALCLMRAPDLGPFLPFPAHSLL